jgi:hypothetical protein
VETTVVSPVQDILPNVEAFGLERVEHKGPHRHVRVVGEAGELLAAPDGTAPLSRQIGWICKWIIRRLVPISGLPRRLSQGRERRGRLRD